MLEFKDFSPAEFRCDRNVEMLKPSPRSLGALLLALSACAPHPRPLPSAAMAPSVATTDPARTAWEAWRTERNEHLAGPDGWVTLVGLFWLADGANEVGSAPDADVALPADRAPSQVGTLTVDHGRVRLQVSPGVNVTHDGAPVTALDIATDNAPGGPTVLSLGSLTMRVIARGDRLALRVKDREHPARRTFHAPEFYPWDARWRIDARFTPTPSRTVAVTNVLGMVEEQPLAGTLAFTVDGHALTLLALWADAHDPSRGLFVMLRDATAARRETYPSGRFLDVDAPDAAGHVVVDLNRLETPPCGFTTFATCPLPPRENVLAIALPAGERNPPGHE